MGLFSLFGKAKGMDDGVAEARSTEGAFLIDVREPNEFASGHVAGATSLPLSELERVGELVEDRSAPIFLYCASGGQTQAQGVHERARHRRYQGLHGSARVGSCGGPSLSSQVSEGRTSQASLSVG